MNTERNLAVTLMRLFDMPFNAGLIGLTGMIWLLGAYYPYYNTNFDLFSSLSGYMVYFSGVCVIAFFLRKDKGDYTAIQAIAMVTFVLSILTLLTVKSVMLSEIGYMLFFPVNVFWLLLLLKNIWLEM